MQHGLDWHDLLEHLQKQTVIRYKPQPKSKIKRFFRWLFRIKPERELTEMEQACLINTARWLKDRAIKENK